MNRAVSVPSNAASYHKDDCLPKHGAVAGPSTHSSLRSAPVHIHNARKPKKDDCLHHLHHKVHRHHHKKNELRYKPTVSSAAAFYAKVIAQQSAKQATTRAETRSRPSFNSIPLSSQTGSLVSKIIASLLGFLRSITDTCMRLVGSTPSHSAKMSGTWQLSVAETDKFNLVSKGRTFKALDNPRIADLMRPGLSVPVTWHVQPAFRKSSRFLLDHRCFKSC